MPFVDSTNPNSFGDSDPLAAGIVPLYDDRIINDRLPQPGSSDPLNEPTLTVIENPQIDSSGNVSESPVAAEANWEILEPLETGDIEIGDEDILTNADDAAIADDEDLTDTVADEDLSVDEEDELDETDSEVSLTSDTVEEAISDEVDDTTSDTEDDEDETVEEAIADEVDNTTSDTEDDEDETVEEAIASDVDNTTSDTEDDEDETVEEAIATDVDDTTSDTQDDEDETVEEAIADEVDNTTSDTENNDETVEEAIADEVDNTTSDTEDDEDETEEQAIADDVEVVVEPIPEIEPLPVLELTNTTPGIFTVGSDGTIRIDYNYDHGKFESEVAIVSIAGLENFFPTDGDFSQFNAEVSRRALSDSELGHIVIADATEGARFSSTKWGPNRNSGTYLGVKSFQMNPGDNYMVVMVPNRTFQETLDKSATDRSQQLLFSVSQLNPAEHVQFVQVAAGGADGNLFAFEDLRIDRNSDKSFNDIVLQMRGGEGPAPLLSDVIDPSQGFWSQNMGQALIDYGDPYLIPAPIDPLLLIPHDVLHDPEIEDLPSDGVGLDTSVTRDDDTAEAGLEITVIREDEVVSDDTTDPEETDPEETDPEEDETVIDAPADTSSEASETVEDTIPDDETPETSTGFAGVPTISTSPPERFDFPKAKQPLVGIIDTGLAANNPDIEYGNITSGTDRVDGDADPLLQPGEGSQHGTHVAGIIAAKADNGFGIDGINPNAPLWVGRAIDSGKWSESLSEFVDATLASEQPNGVVYLGFDLTQINPNGTESTRFELTPPEREALELARQNGIVIVVPAGNQGGVMSVLGQASREFDNIIAVGAAENFDPTTSAWKGFDRVNYSSHGRGLDIVAPGGTVSGGILSTVGSGIGTMAGTSVAAATVAGAVSLIQAANPDLNYRQVKEILKLTATDLNLTGTDGETGAGLLNIPAAVKLAKVTEAEDYDPQDFLIPDTWGGEGLVTPDERAAFTPEQIGKQPTGGTYASGYVAPFKSSVTLTQDWNSTLSHNGTSAYAKDWVIADRQVYATKAGTITYIKQDSTRYGNSPAYSDDANFVIIRHDDGYESLYVHLAAGSVPFNVGDRVQTGEHIGTTGLSGWTTGEHLHFVVRNPSTKYSVPFLLDGTTENPDLPSPTSPGIIPANFTAWVMSEIGANVRSGPGTTFSRVDVFSYETTIEFDAWTYGETITDIQLGTPDARWYRIKGTNHWIASAIVYGNAPDSEPLPSQNSEESDSTEINGYTIGVSFYPIWQQYQGTLGNPTTNEIQYSDGVSYQLFENGSIVSSLHGTFPLYGGIRQAYLNTGGLEGWLGAPTSPEVGQGNGVIKQTFENGYIIWNGVEAIAYEYPHAPVQPPPTSNPTPISGTSLVGKNISLDPGHGINNLGFDPGAAGNGTTEATENLVQANMIAEYLRQRGADVTIIDEPLSLDQIGQRSAGSDAFVALHLNSFNNNAQGHEVYSHPSAPPADSALANAINSELDLTFPDAEIPNRGVKTADFAVLRNAPLSVPAALTEALFIDAPGMSRANVEKAAQAIARGIEKFLTGSTTDPGNTDGGNSYLDQPLLTQQGVSYFVDRPQFYTTGNIFTQAAYGSSLVDGYSGTEGNCTWYAHGRVKELGGNPAALNSMSGHAYEWHTQISNGTQIVYSPQPGDIAQWTSNGQNHVAVVEAVHPNGTMTISESHYSTNWDGGGAGTLHSIQTIGINEPDRYIQVPGV